MPTEFFWVDKQGNEHRMRDVREDPSWGDVVLVERILRGGQLTTVVNHRNYAKGLERFKEYN